MADTQRMYQVAKNRKNFRTYVIKKPDGPPEKIIVNLGDIWAGGRFVFKVFTDEDGYWPLYQHHALHGCFQDGNVFDPAYEDALNEISSDAQRAANEALETFLKEGTQWG